MCACLAEPTLSVDPARGASGLALARYMGGFSGTTGAGLIHS
jgi:hypothetical protein